jgi:hypothetical protein
MKSFLARVCVGASIVALFGVGRGPWMVEAAAQDASQIAPTLIPLTGQVLTPGGEPRTGSALLVISVYADREDKSPLWFEQQIVTLDAQGRYAVSVGATVDGLPESLFAEGSARWLGVAVEGAAEEPRSRLISVPYAKVAGTALNATTLAGRSVEDFVLTPEASEGAGTSKKSSSSDAAGSDVTIQGTVGFIAKFDGAGNATANSVMFESGGAIGVGTSSPVSLFEVPASTSNSSIKAGALELQTYAVNNSWIGENMYWDGTRFARRAAGLATQLYFENGEIMFRTAATGIAGSTVTSIPRLSILDNGRVQAGNLEIQTYGVNNHWIADNLFWDGTSFKRRAAGTGSQIYFDNGEIAFYTAPSGATGATAARTSRLTILNTGNVGIGTLAPVTQLEVAANPANSSIKAGGLELQSYATNNNWIADNVYFSSGFKRRAAGTASQIYFDNGAITFATAPTGAAGAAAALTSRLTVLNNGNVGIGTESPTTKFHVVGDVMVTGNIGAKYQDVAEWVESSEVLEPGTVVVVDPKRSNGVVRSRRGYDAGVAGAVSPQPGVILGEAGPGKVMVAQSGRVKIKVDASYGAIKPGDLLVTSPRAGYAMRSKPVRVGEMLLHRPGTLIGKALDSLATGTGEILVLLTLQ